MHQFTDINGVAWTIDITVDARNQVKAAVPAVDFYDVDCIARLADKETLGAVLFALCQDQIKDRNKTDRDFFRGLKGDVWDKVMEALNAELLDFFQSGERQVLKKALEKISSLRSMTLAKVTQRLESKELDEKLQRTLSGLSGESPVKSESIPDPTPSGS